MCLLPGALLLASALASGQIIVRDASSTLESGGSIDRSPETSVAHVGRADLKGR